MAESSAEALRGLHERAARALPADRIEDAGGWWLRHARGGAWWVRSALPHGGTAPDDLARRIAGTEAFYACHGVAPRFLINPPACADALDAILAERGYRRHDAMSLQGAPTARVLGQARPGPLRVRLDDRPTDAWLRVWDAVNGHGDDLRHERDMLARVERPSAYAGAMDGGEIVAVGRAVADTGWAGLFGMATLPRARGRGAARAVLAALAGFARTQGADRMYLQVEQGNAAALSLYGRAGFGEIRGYHYRTAS